MQIRFDYAIFNTYSLLDNVILKKSLYITYIVYI